MKVVLMVISILLGIFFLYVSWTYFSTPANHLPFLFPGYTMELTKIHKTHAIAALLLAVACFVFAWFQTGKKSSTKK